MSGREPFYMQLRHERERRGLSQEDLAEKLGCNSRTVARWESDDIKSRTYPRPDMVRKLSEVFQKSVEELGLLPEASRESLEDAPRTTGFCGRVEEGKQLVQWITKERCQVVAVLGMGGMGKSTLAARVIESVRDDFTRIFWYSLKNAPPLAEVLQSCLRFLDPQLQLEGLPTVDGPQRLLIRYLHEERCLLVLDNLETLFQPGERVGQYRAGYENYAGLLERLSKVAHNSCLLLTSRETPAELVALEDQTAHVRLLHLGGLPAHDGRKLLRSRALEGTDEQWVALNDRYVGNPLALKLAACSIRDLFGRQIAPFLAEQVFAFDNINDLLRQHFQRLSLQEREVMYWLAIEREACSLETLRANLLRVLPKNTLLSTLQSLKRRSLIEALDGQRFALQPVILEYVTNDLVQIAYAEFLVFTHHPSVPASWQDLAFSQALANDYLRETQIRLILAPLAEQLLSFAGQHVLREQLMLLLEQQRQKSLPQSYLASNVLGLLAYLHFDPRGFDCSALPIRQAYLQNVPLPDTSFAHATFRDTVFTDTFGAILSLAFDPSGAFLAAGTATGEIWLYQVAGGVPLRTYQGHTDGVWALSFSPDGHRLASSSDDGTVRVWHVETAVPHLLLTRHTNRVRAVAFSPDGSLLASGSNDRLIHLWDANSGELLRTLEGHEDWIWSVAFHPAGSLLASGGADQTIRLWDLQVPLEEACLGVLEDHTDRVRAVTFHPAGSLLASASDDEDVRLWSVPERRCVQVLKGHTNRVWSVAFSPDGALLASGSEDWTVRLWETAPAQCRETLPLHTHGVRAVAFSPSGLLASGGDDQSIRLCESQTGNSLKTFQGYPRRIWCLAFARSSGFLISGHEDQHLRVWDVESRRGVKTIPTPKHGIRAIAASPVTAVLASVGEDEEVHLWNVETGQFLRHLQGHTNWLRAVVFSSNGQWLASGGEDGTIILWSVSTGQKRWEACGSQSWVRTLVFHPEGRILASGSDDFLIRLWDTATGASLSTLAGHANNIRSLIFHPTQPWLLSASEDRTIRLWETTTGVCLKELQGHTHRVLGLDLDPTGSFLASCGDDLSIRLWNLADFSSRMVEQAHEGRIRGVVYSPDGTRLASCSDDGKIKLWDASTLALQNELLSERPYERMNITGALGLTDAQRVSLRVLGAIEE